MPKKILILALGDIYWTRFAKHFSSLASENGIECIVAFESRAGEYQAFLGRAKYAAKVYYLTDYVGCAPDVEPGDADAVFGDYLRMSILGQRKQVLSKDWAKIAGLLRAFARHVLDSEDVSVIISDTVSTGFSYVFNQEAISRGIEFWGLSGSRIPKHFIMSRTVRDEAKVVEGFYNEITNGENPITKSEREWALAYIDSIDSQVPDYMKSPLLNSTSLRKFMVGRYFRSLYGAVLYSFLERQDLKCVLFKASPLVGVITAAFRNVGRFFRARLVSRYYMSASDLEVGRFFVYPIHYQPEASTVIGSPYYTDQLSVIRNLAFSMPSGFRLCVKEHVSNVGFPSLDFYDEIRRLPNVVLVSHGEDIKSLIRQGAGVITLTSTAGFEALLLNRPVFHLGDVFYTYHSNAVRLSDWRLVSKQLLNAVDREGSDNVAFLVAYKRYAVEGRLDFSLPDFGVSPVLIEMIKSRLFVC